MALKANAIIGPLIVIGIVYGGTQLKNRFAGPKNEAAGEYRQERRVEYVTPGESSTLYSTTVSRDTKFSLRGYEYIAILDSGFIVRCNKASQEPCGLNLKECENGSFYYCQHNVEYPLADE